MRPHIADRRQLDLAIPDELIIDNFAGGGGTSEGLEEAFGRPVDIAINHDPEALAMHALNHPYTRHLCESVWDVDPIAVTGNQPVGLVWLSPDCKHFSKAKGGTPVEKHIRGLAWVAMRWVAKCRPRVIALENVEEFRTWGPLIIGEDGKARPDPLRKGRTFKSFVRQLREHGYTLDWTELRACDHDTPTIRRRFFMVARRDGLPIVWPEPTNGEPTSAAVIAGKLLPFRTASECIDFSLPARSIFGRARPLAQNTMRRVAKGAWRYVLNNPQPFIVGVGGRMGQSPSRPVSRPAQTVTAKADACIAQPLLEPFIAPLRGTSESHLQGDDTRAPLSTVSAGGTHHALVAANLITIGYGERAGQKARAQDIDQSLGTVVAANKHALVAAHLTHLTHHGIRSGNSASEPLRTVTGAHRGEQALVTAFMEQANGGFYDGDGRAVSVPVSTITASGSNQRLVTAYFVKYYSEGGQWQGANEPMHTLTTKARMGVVQTIQVSADLLDAGQLERAKACAALMHQHLPEHFPEPADIILVGNWVLVDITLRMLTPRELYRAQGFPENYVIDEIPDPSVLFVDGRQVDGDPSKLPRIPLSKSAQVRMCGNSVCPPVAKALIAANFTHEAQIRRSA
ncbi:DNA methyltransferase [Allopusillimonas soli]|uniref:DNA (cytosine-5-)-methyltransferase n=1 Tax=Allopusillimonas soli TaxID=659016 RepID=A0A853FG97_9BURK|nr:DNA cytosine methyltransferase [Allopusillimonas soli]NYT38907.1 DNA cytosine methyltransferase [Allopusillimonas soli]TEA70095.1 DNA methyltransferase [Allopusillimonas soli]